ncbi:MAG TPA: hypothetical protein VEK57_04520 [Thermoanaerobaculia bacterium]|nr:hypothetical protein [Thermoanaerobaculia bacterium]
MKRHIRILLTTIVVVLATFGFALAIGSTRSPLVNEHGEHVRHDDHGQPKHGHDHDHNATVTPHNGHKDHAGHSDHNGDRALTDIHTHAQQHFGHFTARLETFGGTHEWSHEFDLHWLDVEHDGNVVRIYHATDREHPHSRFIWMSHSGNPHPAAWEEVR